MKKVTKNQVVDFTTRLAASRGRFVGITTVKGDKVSKYNGQIVNQSQNYVTIKDRNKNKQFKLAKNTILSLSGV